MKAQPPIARTRERAATCQVENHSDGVSPAISPKNLDVLRTSALEETPKTLLGDTAALRTSPWTPVSRSSNSEQLPGLYPHGFPTFLCTVQGLRVALPSHDFSFGLWLLTAEQQQPEGLILTLNLYEGNTGGMPSALSNRCC